MFAIDLGMRKFNAILLHYAINDEAILKKDSLIIIYTFRLYY